MVDKSTNDISKVYIKIAINCHTKNWEFLAHYYLIKREIQIETKWTDLVMLCSKL